MTRGINEFISRGLHIQKIGLVENNELNKLAFIKAIRSELMLKEVYGFSDTIETNSGIHINTFMFMLFAELTSVFFQNDFIDEFKILYKNTGCTYKSLSMLAFNGILNGMQNRFPMTWAKIDDKINKLTCWSVNETFPNGNEIITRAIIETWSVDLKSLNNNPSLIPRLNERPYYKIGNYLFQFPWVMGLQNNAHSAINNFRRIGNKRTGLLNETRQIEKNIADQLRLKNISVVCGYQPERSENEDPGEIDIIAYADGILLLIEVKSGYIRSSKKEAWLHKNGALRKASWQLQRKSIAVKEALLSDEHLREQLNLTNKETHQTFKSWIIDTSLEFDGQSIDGYFVTSLETLLIALRDEKSMLLDIDKTNEDIPRNGSLYRDSFTMREFIDIIEFGKVWHGLI